MNITLNGTKITQDTRNLAFEKNNNVDEIVVTVDTDESWSYKLDVKYPDKYNIGNDTLYNIIDLNRNGSICSATLDSKMLPFNGKYTMQLRGISGDKVYHSDIFVAWVKYSIEPGSTYDPVPSEFYQIEAKLDDKVNEAKQYAENAETASTRMPKISSGNTWLIWDVGNGDYVDTGIKASGADGKDGEDGVGIVSVEYVGVDAQGGYNYKINLTDGTSYNFTAPKGETGPKGEDGANATITNVTASVDGNIGTPEVEVTLDGTESARAFNFAFKNLKGETGEIGPKGDPFTYADFTPEQLEELRGPQGIPGKDGSDATVTAGNIESALGYTPASGEDVNQLKQDLSAEQAARKQADTSLQQEVHGKLPKSPVNWEPWTADEQAAACERMGVEHIGEWEEIVTVTTEEAVSSLTVDTDANGNPFSLTHVIYELILPIGDMQKTRNVYFGSGSVITPTDSFVRVPVYTSNTVKYEAVAYAKIISGKIYCDGAIATSIPNNYQVSEKYGIVNGCCKLSAESFDRIFVVTYDDAFPAGSQLIIRGIRK